MVCSGDIEVEFNLCFFEEVLWQLKVECLMDEIVVIVFVKMQVDVFCDIEVYVEGLYIEYYDLCYWCIICVVGFDEKMLLVELKIGIMVCVFKVVK